MCRHVTGKPRCLQSMYTKLGVSLMRVATGLHRPLRHLLVLLFDLPATHALDQSLQSAKIRAMGCWPCMKTFYVLTHNAHFMPRQQQLWGPSPH